MTPTQFTLPLSDLKREWIATVALAVPALMAGLEFTTDDLHDFLPEPGHPNWLGCAIAKLRNEGVIERLGYRQSQRPSANGRVVAVWRVKALESPETGPSKRPNAPRRGFAPSTIQSTTALAGPHLDPLNPLVSQK